MGACASTVQAYSVEPGLPVAKVEVKVMDGIRYRNVTVGVGVSEGVLVAVGVKVGVADGVMNIWVCEAAAFAVSAMKVPSEFGSKVGMGVGARASVGMQASAMAAAVKRSISVF